MGSKIMKKIIIAALLLMAGCSFASPKVEIKREIVTNNIAPIAEAFNFSITNIGYVTNICISVTNDYSWNCPYCSRLRAEQIEQQKTIDELTYPKTSIDVKYVWEYIHYTVKEKGREDVRWAISNCLSQITFETVIEQTIKTNKTETIINFK